MKGPFTSRGEALEKANEHHERAEQLLREIPETGHIPSMTLAIAQAQAHTERERIALRWADILDGVPGGPVQIPDAGPRPHPGKVRSW